jgi:hypothetical protein
MMLPASQRSAAIGWASHGDRAAKALANLAGPHLPACLAQLERAVKRALTPCTRRPSATSA